MMGTESLFTGLKYPKQIHFKYCIGYTTYFYSDKIHYMTVCGI